MPGIDLRTPEFIKEREFYWPRVFKVTGLVLYGFLVFNLIFYLHFLKGEEVKKLSLLQEKYEQVGWEKEKSYKEQETLIALQREKETLEILLAMKNNWYPYLDLFFKGTDDHINIQNIKGNNAGTFTLEGWSGDLKGIAQYMLFLQETGKFDDMNYREIIKGEGEGFYFSFTGRTDFNQEIQVFQELDPFLKEELLELLEEYEEHKGYVEHGEDEGSEGEVDEEYNGIS